MCYEIRSAEMMYALDQISVTADDLQKLSVSPTEVCFTSFVSIVLFWL